MATKVALVTSERRFDSIEDAARHYSMESSLIKVRISRGWSNDEACNLVPRIPPVKNLDQTSFVYGWWSVPLERYVYVGLTTNSIQERTAAHWNSVKNGGTGKFCNFLRGQSPADFEVHELWRGEVRSVAAMEVYFIREKGTLLESGGFNTLPGGSLGGVGVGKVVKFEGRVFDTAKHFAKYVNLPYGFVISKLNSGVSPEEIAKSSVKRRDVAVNGELYKSLADACKKLDVPYARISSRIAAGWSVDEAFNKRERYSGGATPVSKMKEYVVDGVTYKSLSEAARAHGVEPGLAKRRIGLGWPLEKALSSEKYTRKGVKNRSAQC